MIGVRINLNRSISLKWLLRFVSILVLLLCGYVFLLLSPIWEPILSVTVRVSIPFIIAAIITYLLHPIVEQMKNIGVARPVSILLIYVAFIFLFGYLIVKGTPYIIEELKDLIENIPQFANIYRELVTDFYKQTSMMPEGFRATLEGWLGNIERIAAQGLVGIVASLGGIVDYFLVLIIVPFLVFYLLKDFSLIEKSVWYLTPRRWRSSGKELLREINISLGNYIRGQLFVCLVVAVIATIGLLLIDMPYAVILGIFIGITNIIPYFGPIIGALPVAIIALTESFQLVLLGLLVNFLIQLVEGNILAPLIVGKSLHMHPILIMFALIVGAEVGGVVGLILSVPILAVIKVFIIHIRNSLKHKHGEETGL